MKSKICILCSLVLVASAMVWSCTDAVSEKPVEKDAPVITKLVPEIGSPGVTLVIQGENFTTKLANIVVTFGEQLGEVVAAQPHAIAVRVPYADPGTDVDITVAFDELISNSKDFVYTNSEPEISGLDKEEASAGETIVISGSHLVYDAENTTVIFGDTPATIIRLNPNSIEVQVPEGEEGNIVDIKVTTTGMASNVVSFKYKSPLPTITEMSKTSGLFGEELTITGQYFSKEADRNHVYFRETANPENVVEAEVITSSETELKVIIPYIYKEEVEVVVAKEVQDEMSTSLPQSFSFNLAECDRGAWDNAVWTTEQLRADVEWRHAEFRVFGYEKKLHMNIIAITPGAGGIDTKIGIAVKDDGQCQSTTAFGESLGALAVINGGYFIMDDSSAEAIAYGTASRSLDHIRIDGVVVESGRDRRNSGPALPAYLNVCMAFDSQGDYEIAFCDLPMNKTRNSTSAKEFGNGTNPARAQGYDYAIAAGPRIITNGTALNRTPNGDSHYDSYRPRTFVGVDASGVMYFVTFDGDSSVEYQGITINNGAYFMKLLGCENAMNLDGGGSTTMWIKDKGKVSDVTNSTYERPVANVLYVK